MVSHVNVAAGGGSLMAADLNRSCAALSHTTMLNQSMVCESRDGRRGPIIVNQPMKLNAFALIMSGIVFEVLGQILFKRGAVDVVRVSGVQDAFKYWGQLLLHPCIQLGVVIHVVALLLWVAALGYVPLSIAFPLTSLSYCGAALGAHYVLGERLDRRAVLAIALITCGTILVWWPFD
jgi:undecaprenyl phosphate-alpha-L-ara4N flippase subunit ArnE